MPLALPPLAAASHGTHMATRGNTVRLLAQDIPPPRSPNHARVATAFRARPPRGRPSSDDNDIPNYAKSTQEWNNLQLLCVLLRQNNLPRKLTPDGCRVILAYMCVKLLVRLYVCHCVGPFWVHFRSILGPFWVHVGSMLGPCWVHVGSMLGPCWVHVERRPATLCKKP